MKGLYNVHLKTKNFIKRLINYKNSPEEISEKMKKSKHVWEIDKNITIKLSGHKNVLDYYHNFSCEKDLINISKPSLFLNNLEDPICVKENIPIDVLYKNENVINLVTNRGGHIEYLNGFKSEWWAFLLSIHYFKFFENNESCFN